MAKGQMRFGDCSGARSSRPVYGRVLVTLLGKSSHRFGASHFRGRALVPATPALRNPWGAGLRQ